MLYFTNHVMYRYCVLIWDIGYVYKIMPLKILTHFNLVSRKAYVEERP